MVFGPGLAGGFVRRPPIGMIWRRRPALLSWIESLDELWLDRAGKCFGTPVLMIVVPVRARRRRFQTTYAC
jgi:hypothetical protein